MDASVRGLIQQLARKEASVISHAAAGTGGYLYGRHHGHQQVKKLMHRALPLAGAAGVAVGAGAHAALSKKDDDKDNHKKKASSDMHDIIDDIIKGAEQNSFGRRVNVQQGFDPSPLDLAKFAGALTAFSELGYSVKEAADALGLTEKQVQHIIDTVR